jgi:O-antigen ligase
MHQHKGLKLPIYFCLLVILAIPLIVTNDLAFIFITGKNFTFRVTVEVLFALYILLMVYAPQYQPRFSWILVSFALFLFFSCISAIYGIDPGFSFLGSYQRMDGVVTIAHLFIYFIVLSHVIKTENAWSYVFYASITVATIVAIIGIIKYDLSSTLGNHQFSAILLFFNVFFIVLLIVRSSSILQGLILGCIGAFLCSVMFLAGERGVLCATLIAGIISVWYVSRFRQNAHMKYFAITLTLSIILVILFISKFHPELFENSQRYMRYFSIEWYFEGMRHRANLWSIAFNGFKDHPVFGWGINNFPYVFNKYYNSFYCSYDMWMDKAHNNYLEWLVSGGIFGFCAFLGLIFTPIIYICTKGKKLFSTSERAVLLGLLSGYLTLNVFYFDTITSYICLINVLAYIHAYVSTPLPKWEFPKKYIPFTIMPILIIATTSLIYYLTLPSFLAAREAMLATQTPDIKGQYQWMHKAWMRHGIGNLELLEKFNPIVQSLLVSNAFSPQEKFNVAHEIETELKQYIANKPLDPRAYYFLISLNMTTNDLEKAKQTLTAVWLLTPKKEYTIMLQGAIEFGMGHLEDARNLFIKSICVKTSRTLYDRVNEAIEQQKKRVIEQPT